MPAPADRERLDKWLWAARFFKTRALAAEAVDGGRVQVNGERVKRAKYIHVGDRIRIRHGALEWLVTIRALSERRGPAKVAATLFEEDELARRTREERAQQLRAMPATFHDGKGRPTKRQRREIDQFKRGLGLALLLSLPGTLGAQSAAPAPDALLPMDSAVTAGTLGNGLRYYVRPNGKPERRAELRLVVRAGSVLEDDDQLGLAHFVEHMAFNGTRRFARQDLVNYLEMVGMRMGPDLNAYTSYDETVYMLQVPTDSADVFRTAFAILEDWATAVSFTPEEIEKERGVVIEEWRLGQGAAARLRDKQFPIIFQGSRYAERPPIGQRGVLETFAHASLERFYRTWYRPDLMAVVAVGDFDPAEVEDLIHEHFGRIPRSPDTGARPSFDIPNHAEPRFAIATDPEATGSSVSVLYKQPLRDHRTYGAYRQHLVEALFTAMLNARLFELSQSADPPFLGAGTGQGRFVGENEVFSLGAAVAVGGVARGLAALLTEAERVRRFGFTATELERHKTRRLRYLERLFDEREKSESRRFAGELIRHFLAGDPAPGIQAELDLHRYYLPDITRDEVNRLASEWITDHNRVVVVSAPDKPDVPVPSAAELQDVFTGLDQIAVEPFEDSATDGPLLATAPVPSPVVEERTIPDLGVTVWRLANGISVFLKSTDFQDDEILFEATSPGGYSLAGDDEHVSAYFSDIIVTRSGVGAFNAVDLEKALTGTAVRVRPFVSELWEGLSGGGSPRDIETLFQLIHLYVTAPRLDSTAFLALRAQFLSLADDRRASPEAAFRDTMQVTMAQYHPRERPLTPQLIEDIDLEEAFAFYRDRFADAGDFAFFFVGNLQPDSLRPLVETYLGGLPVTGRQETWGRIEIRPPQGIVRREVFRGMEPKAQTEIIFTGPFRDTREDRHILGSLAAALQLRLREVLREDLGGTYSVGVGSSSSISPDTTYAIHIGFGAAPDRLEELTAVVFGEIRRFQASGPADSVVQKVRESQRRDYELRLQRNGFWLDQLVAAYRRGADPRVILDYEVLIDSLTPETLARAAEQYLRSDNYVQVSLYPEPGTP